MASDDSKLYYDDKNGSPVASTSDEPVVAGHVSTLKRRLPGFSLAVPHEESSFAASSSASNADFDPIPPSKRTWNWGAYVAYWMADAWAVSNWEVGKFVCGVGGAQWLLKLFRCSFVHDLRRAQLENGNRCLCAW
jgi:NCS1 family nucleobase:cation symporter-1